jgi:putative ABC transport system ATP-binding protein
MMGFQPPRARRKRAKELLELVGLGHRMNHLPSQLSGGQRQRVAVARALANYPPLILADEPTGNLDTAAGNELMKLLREINQTQGTTLIVVTHDLGVARQTRRVIVMADGKIAREDRIGSPIEEDLKVWSHSGLARRIIQNDHASLAELGITEKQVKVLKQIFEQNFSQNRTTAN